MRGLRLPFPSWTVRRLVVLIGLLLPLLGSLAVVPAARADSTVACDAGAIQSAVNAGGTYSFAGPCMLSLGSSITVGGNATTLDAAGNAVILSGGPPSSYGFTCIKVNGGTLTLKGITIHNCYSGFGAGGMYISPGTTVNLIGTVFTGNAAAGGPGGAIYSYGNLTVANSTFVGNSGPGAAIAAYGVTTVVNSTFAGNDPGPFGTILVHSSVNLINDLMVGESSELYDYQVNVSSHNLIGVPSGATLGQIIATDGSGNPLLANNGGSTQTIALAPSTVGFTNPAIGRADPATCATSQPGGAGGVDGRGMARAAASCDIGAYDTGDPVAGFSVGTVTPSQPVAFTDTSTGIVTSWSWDFGDGGTSTAQNPSHTFGPGTYPVTLTVANAQGGQSTSTRQVVLQAAQTITFGPLADVTYGAPDFAVTATADSGLPVALSSLTTGVCTVSGGTVHLASAGRCTIEATQGGDSSYAAAATVDQSFTVNPAPLTITASSPTITYNGAVPSITPSYSGLVDGDTAPATAPTCGSTAPAGGDAGTYPTDCSGATDPNYTIAYVDGTLTIKQAPATLTLSNLTQTYDGAPEAAAVTTSPAGLSGVSVTYNGAATAPTAAGSYSVVASLSNPNYQAGDATGTLVIGPAIPGISWSNPGDIVYGAPLGSTQLNATASVPGTFAYTPVTGTVLHAGSGQLLSMRFTPADATDYTGATASVSINVTKANQTISFGALPGRAYGAGPFAVAATASSGLAVSFSASPASVCTVSGSTVAITGAGACTVTATQPGNGDYNPASSVPQTFAVAKAGTSTALASSANPSKKGQAVTFTATITSPAGTPTSGTVTFMDGSTVLGTGALNSLGVATFATSSLSKATHSITARYGGSSNFSTSASGVLAQTVK